MLDFTDFALEQKRVKERIKARRDEQLKLQRQVAVVMSEVKADPRWKIYADHIQAVYENHLAVAEAAKKRLGDPLTFMSPEESGKLKLQAAYNQGKAEGYKGALDMIKDLIDRGKEPTAAAPNE